MSKLLEENIKNISKEILFQKYIIENKTYKEIQNEFNISETSLYNLIKYYDIKKPKYLSNKIHRKINVEKRKETIIEKYGSLENYKLHISNKSKDMWKKRDTNERKELAKKIVENGGGWNHKKIHNTVKENK